MRAILIGGPRHLTEFEMGDRAPTEWIVPNPAPSVSIDEWLALKEPETYFDTATYEWRTMLNCYQIYTLRR